MSSFLQSILSSIGDGQQVPPPPPAARPSSNSIRTNTNESLVRQATGSNGTNSNPTRPEKRKAGSDSQTPPVKVARRDTDPPPPSRPAPNPNIKPVTKTSSNLIPNSLPQRPNPNVKASSANTDKSSTKLPNVAAGSSSIKSRPIAKPPQAAAPSAPPARGSYAQLLARAKAEQEEKQTVGAIKHKKLEKVSKKEKERLTREAEEQAKAKAAASAKEKRGAPSISGRPGQNMSSKKTELPAEKPKKKAVDLGYSGTMRPSEPASSYKGTMGQKSQSNPRKLGGNNVDRNRSGYGGHRSTEQSGRGKVRMAGYASYSEDDLNDDEDDYDSGGSSDMEAAAFEVEDEEAYSLNSARKEDLEAQRQEDEHKRQKELRKKTLAKLAANADAKKKRRL